MKRLKHIFSPDCKGYISLSYKKIEKNGEFVSVFDFASIKESPNYSRIDKYRWISNAQIVHNKKGKWSAETVQIKHFIN